MDYVVEHRPERLQFRIRLQQGEAVLEYQWRGATTLDFSRTYVPGACRGKGLAEKLVREGLRWAGSQDCEIVASCWYVAKFLS